LVRQIFEAAVDDRLRRDNPCRVKGAATERSVERQIPSLEQVAALADGIAPRYRAMVLVAALAGLRKGECLGLARRHLDLTAEPPIVRIERALVYTDAGPIMQEPKTTAGHRTLALPPILVDELNEHLAAFVAPAADALLFTDAKTGASPRKDRIRWEWVLACRAAGVECSFHDLRHVAGTLNAAAGATIKEAMARLGHASPVAALRYQHAVQSRDAEIAAAVGNIALPALGSRRSPGGHVQPTS
jgi:integrase